MQNETATCTHDEPPYWVGTQLTEHTPTEGYFTCIHHRGPSIEYSRDIRERLTYIREDKAREESPERIAQRLHHIAYVPTDRVPEDLDDARKAFNDAREAYHAMVKITGKTDAMWKAFNDARESYDAAWEAHNAARESYADELNALVHELIPNCQWDGTTIFPEEEA